jgi:hypothetical protein
VRTTNGRAVIQHRQTVPYTTPIRKGHHKKGREMMPLPSWLVHDEDGKAVQVDLPRAVRDGAEVLTVSHNTEEGRIDVKVQREMSDSERVAMS